MGWWKVAGEQLWAEVEWAEGAGKGGVVAVLVGGPWGSEGVTSVPGASWGV